MKSRFLAWLRFSMGYLWLVALALYLAISAGQAVLHNYQSQQDTKQLQQELAAKEQEKERLQALVVYYQTDSYKEKELRQDLLLKIPGETAYALPESSQGLAQAQAAAAERVKHDPRLSAPIWRQWIDYVTQGRED